MNWKDPTKDQVVQWARECEASVAEHRIGQAWRPWKISFRPDQLQAFALKVLAEKELEVLSGKRQAEGSNLSG